MHLTALTTPLDCRTRMLHRKLLAFSFFNFFLVALTGLWLRSFPFLSYPLDFKNVLHGHSHFAFGGWVLPVLLAMALRYIPHLALKIPYQHWRNLSVLLLVSAYGMLFSFPFGGYYLISIIFSTLSVLGGFYFAYLVFRASSEMPATVEIKFLKWAMFYGILSSAGPFLTAPLIVMGLQGTPVYYNAIYFYLHFQYNGIFSFLLLAIFYSRYFKNPVKTNGLKVFKLLNLAIIPGFALSLLWTKPSLLLNGIGASGAILQLYALYFLFADLRQIKFKGKNFLILVFFALGLKFLLQLFSAFPAVAALAYENRNFIIAYLHLVLLGFISMFVMALVWPAFRKSSSTKAGIYIFIFGFLTTELLLVLQPVSGFFMKSIPGFSELLFLFSCLFPLGIGLILFHSFYKKENEIGIRAEILSQQNPAPEKKIITSVNH